MVHLVCKEHMQRIMSLSFIGRYYLAVLSFSADFETPIDDRFSFSILELSRTIQILWKH